MINVKKYFKAILIPAILGGIIGIIISGYLDYEILEKPLLSPPNIVFPIVWTILYVLMGISYGILDDKLLVDSDINKIYYNDIKRNWNTHYFNI